MDREIRKGIRYLNILPTEVISGLFTPEEASSLAEKLETAERSALIRELKALGVEIVERYWNGCITIKQGGSRCNPNNRLALDSRTNAGIEQITCLRCLYGERRYQQGFKEQNVGN